MVYPEQLILDQAADKSTCRASWCNDLESTSNIVTFDATKQIRCKSQERSAEVADRKIQTASTDK